MSHKLKFLHGSKIVRGHLVNVIVKMYQTILVLEQDVRKVDGSTAQHCPKLTSKLVQKFNSPCDYHRNFDSSISLETLSILWYFPNTLFMERKKIILYGLLRTRINRWANTCSTTKCAFVVLSNEQLRYLYAIDSTNFDQNFGWLTILL